MTPEWKQSAASRAERVPQFVLCAQLTTRSFGGTSDGAIKFTPAVFFLMETWGFLALSFSVYWFSWLHLAFFFLLKPVQPKAQGSHGPCAFCFPAQIRHYSGIFVCKSSISYVLCHILYGRLSRCYDCTKPNCRATQGWKRDEHSLVS